MYHRITDYKELLSWRHLLGVYRVNRELRSSGMAYRAALAQRVGICKEV